MNGYKGIFVAILCAYLLAACGSAAEAPTTIPPTAVPPTATAADGLPNPASVFCEENGGTVELREEAAGQYGVCIFSDGSECEEWSYYRRECHPGDSLSTPAASATWSETTSPVAITLTRTVEPSPEATTDISSWIEFTQPDYGFRFRYPSSWAIEEDLRPQSTAYRHLYWLKPASDARAVLTIGFRYADEEHVGIQRTGVGSGELVTSGTVNFLHEPVNRVFLVSEDKTMGLLYNGGGEIARGELRFALNLDWTGDWTDPAGIGAEVAAVTDAIVSSFEQID